MQVRPAALKPAAAALVALASLPVASLADGTAITLYSSAAPGAIQPRPGGDGMPAESIPGFGVVRQDRQITLPQGRGEVRFTDVAALIDPTTVSFQSLTDPEGTHVVEQNYQFDLVNTSKLLQKYVDRSVTVEQQRGQTSQSFSGTLLSTSGGLVLRNADGSVQVVNGYQGVKLPELPGGLITRPTLVWDVAARRAGPHTTRVSYQTGGITWWADYNLVLSEAKGCRMDAGAWVSILNQSGATYPDARLKLVAGDVNRVTRPDRARADEMRMLAKAAAAAPPGFEEKAFFEYHLYTLGRPTTLPDNSTKQIELFPSVQGAACEKVMLYYGVPAGYRTYGPNPATDRAPGVPTNKKVDVYLQFRNSAENRMGMPLPAGRVRVSKLDEADGSLEFIGEDAIDHTPKDEKVLIRMGSAFDVVGERRQVNFTVDTSRRTMEEEIEVKLRNHKQEPVTVLVKENLYRWTTWRIAAKTQDFEKLDARTIQFPVKVPKSGEATLRYTVVYTW